MPRPVRSGLALVVAVLSASFVLACSTATASFASSADCATGSENRQPVLLVHGYNSGPSTWDANTRNGFTSISGVCITVFDYEKWSTHWVNESHIGPQLATTIEALSAASKTGGGTGKVIIVAHSMGGLAARCALASSCNGGDSDVADHVRELITLGTPNTGTYLRGNGLQGVGEKTLGSLLSSTCYVSFNGANPICEFVRAIGTSEATRAFTPESAQLNALPEMPADIPVFAMAAHVEAVTSLFGWQSVDIGNAGDLIVKEDSALDQGVRYGKLGGTQTIDCGEFNVLRMSGSNCWHSTETNDGRFIAAAIKQINLAKQPAPKKVSQDPPSVHTTTTVPSHPTPQTQQGSSYSPGAPFDDYCVINWPTAPTYTSSSIQMVMGCKHVDQNKFFFTQVVYGDPKLPVTPSTGAMHVVGHVIDSAHSAYGFNVLVVEATKITIGG